VQVVLVVHRLVDQMEVILYLVQSLQEGVVMVDRLVVLEVVLLVLRVAPVAVLEYGILAEL
jgi:hypothetical protein